jgi:MFS family permease
MNRVIRLLLVTLILYNIALTLMGPVLAAYVKSVGGTVEDTGDIFGMSTWISCVCLIGIPIIKNKFCIGDLPLLVISYAFPIIAGVWYLYIKSVDQVYIVNALISFTEAMSVPILFKWYSNFLKLSNAEEGWGYHDAALAITAGLGGLLGAELASGKNFSNVFYVFIAFAVLAFLVMLFVYVIYNKDYSRRDEIIAEDNKVK